MQMPLLLAEFDVWNVIHVYAIGVLKVILIIFAAWFIGGWLGRMTTRCCEKAKIETTLARFFGKLTFWAIMILAGIFVLSVFNINTTSLAAVIGAATLAIGLALQGTLSNFSAGVMLLIFRPFKVGDFVEINGESGTVHEIDLFNTFLDTPDNKRIILPNGSVFGSNIENVTFHPKRRLDVAVGTEYSADIDKVREVLMGAARSIEGRLQEEEPMIVLLELGDSSINWSVRIWVNTSDYWPLRDKLTRACKYALDEANIGIPFPQMDVHVNGSLQGQN